MDAQSLSFRLATRSDLPLLLRLYSQLASNEHDVLELHEAEAMFSRIEAYHLEEPMDTFKSPLFGKRGLFATTV